METAGKICVVVRKRPISKKEEQKGEVDIIEKRDSQTIVAVEPKLKVDLTKYIEEHHFTFDAVFDETAGNEEVYKSVVKPLVSSAFKGTKVTCFAYGQTGSGKTYTMLGPPNEGLEVSTVPGLFLLAGNDIFLLKEERHSNIELWVSFYEIYSGKLYDLLNQRKILFVREDAKQSVNIVGLAEKQVNSVEELMELIAFGLGARTTGVTGANVDSSRSHAILQICLKDTKARVRGKISFIDLAGSERAADTIEQDKQTRLDGAEINKSLLALKECIRALDQDKRHTPFRGSKLTLVLKDSFVGNCKTVMIANVSPTASCCEHTLNTLRYADRVKELKKNPTGVVKDQADLLAQALMLPRRNGNAVRLQSSRQMPELVKAKSAAKKVSPFKLEPSTPKMAKIEGLNGLQPRSPPVGNSPLSKGGKPGTAFVNLAEADKWSLGRLAEEHEKMIDKILDEEDELINSHKSHIDAVMDLSKKELSLLNNVSSPGSDIDNYVKGLDSILQNKYDIISSLKNKLDVFQTHLKEEASLSKKFNELQKQENEKSPNPLDEIDLLKDDVRMEDGFQ